MPFLNKLEPFILSQDETLRFYALEVIDKSHLGTEETFFKALEALDQLPIDPMKNKIVPYLRKIPLTERMVEELIERLQREDGNQVWYVSLLESLETVHLLTYKDQLAPIINKNTLASYVSLLDMERDELLEEADSVIQELESSGFNQSLFQYGKRVYRELISRQELSKQEIERVILENKREDYFSYKGIYYVYLAGVQKVTELVPLLSTLLERTREDLLLEEVANTFIKMNTEEVIQHVEKYLIDLDTAYSAVEIIENIKLPLAEEVLLHHFDKATDMTIKTMIADALCKQLSIKAIPLLATFVEEDYDRGMMNLKEPLYACCVINNIRHPQVLEWKQSIQEEKDRLEKRLSKLTQTQVKSQKVGRNEPCPCGSGKKYKKCCEK